MPNLYSSNNDNPEFGVNNFYKHLGFSTTIQESFGHITTSPEAITVLDQANLVTPSGGSGSTIIRYKGFTSSILDSFQWLEFGFFDGVAWGDGAPDLFVSWVFFAAGVENIGRFAGFSDTLLDSFRHAFETPGISWTGVNLLSSSGFADRIFEHVGFSNSIVQSFASPGPNPFDVGYDGTNLVSVDLTEVRLYLHTGISATITTSIASPDARPRGISWGTTIGDNQCELAEGTEQHHLDVVFDTKRPDWQRIQDVLANYRSTLIFSDGKYKLITDRDDLPVRHVFHAGNIVPGTLTLEVVGNISKPNQVIVEFPNQLTDYVADVLFVQDSVSVFSSLDPIRSLDASAVGITRKSEAQRMASVLLKQNLQVNRAVSFQTGLEALIVEPGDRCRVGILTTDFAMGYGGRALGGSTTHIVVDREVEVLSGTYEIVVWHTAADTLETRTVLSGEGKRISLQPTVAFDNAVVAGDRWALGISSEDLLTATILNVTREENGNHKIVAQEYTPVFFTLDCPTSLVTVASIETPSQPGCATAIASLCVASISVVTAPSCEGSILVSANSTGRLFFDTIHNPTDDSLFGETLRIVSGPASGDESIVIDWDAVNDIADISPPLSTTPNSGDSYQVEFRQNFAGMEIEVSGQGAEYGFDDYGAGPYNGTTDFTPAGTIFGTVGGLDLSGFGDQVSLKIIPFSSRGIRNTVGTWVLSLETLGCSSLDFITDGNTISGQNEVAYFSAVLPGQTFGTANRLKVEITGLITEVCSPLETTLLRMGLKYGSETLVDSLVITLSDTVNAGVGTELATFIEAIVLGAGVTSKQSATLRYRGETATGFQNIAMIGNGTVDSTLAHTMTIFGQFEHRTDSLDIHTHDPDCHFLTFESGTTQVTSV